MNNDAAISATELGTPDYAKFIGRSSDALLETERTTKSYVVAHCETTGLDPLTDAVYDVALVRFRDGELVDLLCSFVFPERSIPAPVLQSCDDRLISVVDSVLLRGEPLASRRSLCPCANGKRFVDCHRARVKQVIAVIPKHVAQAMRAKGQLFLNGLLRELNSDAV